MTGRRVALVTGGGRGIGRAIAERLARDGHHVIVAARTETEVAATAGAICAQGGSADALVLDISDSAAVKTQANALARRHGRLDVLVNSAAISYISPVVLGKPDRWEAVLRVNLLGALAVTQAALRPMIRARWGRIVHIGSISGSEVGAPFNAVYAASKAGISGLVRSVALEVGPVGITVNAVAPGYVRTELFQQTQGTRSEIKGVTRKAHERDLLAEIPTGRFVEPHEVAAAVAFLVSDDAASVTGQVWNVDGGRTVT